MNTTTDITNEDIIRIFNENHKYKFEGMNWAVQNVYLEYIRREIEQTGKWVIKFTDHMLGGPDRVITF
jgi:hypothetical protein